MDTNRGIVFVETSPFFQMAWKTLTELQQNGRLTTVLSRLASSPNNYVPGAQNQVVFDNILHFSRRLSASTRMFMMAASGLEPIPHFMNNQVQPAVEGPPFTLAEEDASQLFYYSQHDQLYPHYAIRDEINEAIRQDNRNHSMNRRMLIFRTHEEKRQLIEIGTTMTILLVEHEGTRGYSCILTCRCVVSYITEGDDGPWFRHLLATSQGQLPCVPIPIQVSDDDPEDDDSDEDCSEPSPSVEEVTDKLKKQSLK